MHRVIQCGVGGYGELWVKNLRDCDRVDVVAMVDTSAEALDTARAVADVDRRRCYQSLEVALGEVEADALVCVVPPAAHEEVATLAIRAGLDVLTEKPLSDTIESGRRLAALAESTGRMLMVAQKGRYQKWVAGFREQLRSGVVGELSHLTLHFRAADFRWGMGSDFRHHMADPLLKEMSIHHFDLIRALLRTNAVRVTGMSWNSPWSGFEGDIAASLTFTMSDGTPVVYEAYNRSSGDLTSWFGDIRAECETGTVAMVAPNLVVTGRGANQKDTTAPRRNVMEIEDVTTVHAQSYVLDEFLDAREQGRSPETSAADNLESMAMLFAAIEACHTGMPQDVRRWSSTAALGG